MLTGDKVETAKTIGYSCNLLQEGMVNYEIIKNTELSIKSKLDYAIKEIESPDNDA